MLHKIPPRVRARMRFLERLDGRHRRERVHQFDRLRQIPPVTGRFLAVLAAGTPEGKILEIGTSGGYSTLWLSLACRAGGRRITTFEMAAAKIALANETFRSAGIADMVDLVEGDARENLGRYKQVAFCFLDAEKHHYLDCYNLVVPNMVSGGLLVADNITSHRDAVAPMVRRALRDIRADSVIVPIGSGLLLCRKT